MPTIALTDMAIRALKVPLSGQQTYFDKALTGFGVRVSQGGTKTFVLIHGANRRRSTIGRYPVLSLSDARTEAKRILAEQTLGKTRLPNITFDEAKNRFLAHCEQRNRPRTVYDYRRILDRHFRFGKTRLADISRHEVMRRIDKLYRTPAEQNYAFVVARAFFRYAVRNGLLDRNPMEAASLPAIVKSRERVLSPTELVTVFDQAKAHPYPFGPIVSLLLLTGQRRGEIAALRWEWINHDERTITLPDVLTKNRRTHRFPFGEKVAAVLSEVPQNSEFLFPATTANVRGKPTTVFNGWSKAKERFDGILENVAPWTLHDLRRTFSSTLAALGTPIHVTEKLLNHVSGTVSGVTAVYNRHSYMDEMREAIRNFEQYIDRSVASPRMDRETDSA